MGFFKWMVNAAAASKLGTKGGGIKKKKAKKTGRGVKTPVYDSGSSSDSISSDSDSSISSDSDSGIDSDSDSGSVSSDDSDC